MTWSLLSHLRVKCEEQVWDVGLELCPDMWACASGGDRAILSLAQAVVQLGTHILGGAEKVQSSSPCFKWAAAANQCFPHGRKQSRGGQGHLRDRPVGKGAVEAGKAQVTKSGRI